MYQRKVRPYQFGLPEIPQTRPMMGQGPQGSVSHTEGGQQSQFSPMQLLPAGMLARNLLKPAPYSMASELPTSQGLMDGYIGAMGPADAYAGAMEGISPSLGFSTPYLDGLAGGYESFMPASSAFSLGSAGTGAAEGFGMGAGEAGLLGSGASGAATGATAAGEAGGAAASGAATGAMAAIPVWGWAALAASLAKSQVQGSDPSSPAGVLDTMLLPSIDQWMADPGGSLVNTVDPVGTALGDVTGLGDESWYSFLSPSGLLNLFG